MQGDTMPFQLSWRHLYFLAFLLWLVVMYWFYVGFSQYSPVGEEDALSATSAPTSNVSIPDTPKEESQNASTLSPPCPTLPPAHLPPVFFPEATALYANPFDVYPPYDPIYPNQRVTSHHSRLRHLLDLWIHLANSLDLHYVATAGTLLGCIRNGKIIPWDRDIDLAIDRETAVRISYLAADNPPGGLRRFTLNGLSVELNSAVINHQPWESGESRLIVNNHRAHNLPGYGPRYNRTGHEVPEMEDSVSFAGPFARLVSWVDGDGSAHIDLFCVEEFAGKYGEEATEVGPELATFPRKLEPCQLEGRPLWCPSKEDYEPIMVENYGHNYLTPPEDRMVSNAAENGRR